MKTLLFSIISFLHVLIPLSLSAEGTLEDHMKESGWIRIIGTWVDEETKGEKLTTSYAWRFSGTLIEETTRFEKKEFVSLIGLNPKSGEIFLMSADNQGGSSIGTFKGNDNGSATLGALFVTREGEEGALGINYRFEDDDTLILTLELAEPIVLRLVRSDKVQSPEQKAAP